MNITRKSGAIEIPILIDESEGQFYATIDDSKNILGINLFAIGQGGTEEEAKKKLLTQVKIYIAWMQSDSVKLRKYQPLRLGPWTLGGKWFTIFGFGLYFRLSNQKTKRFMKGGFFIPLTNLNISFMNEWRVKNGAN